MISAIFGLILMVCLIFVVSTGVYLIARRGFKQGLIGTGRMRPVSCIVLATFVILKFTYPAIFFIFDR
jgi:hypothetical protein